MFLHLMVNDVKIVEETFMSQILLKMYKFTKQFNLCDSVKYVADSFNDRHLYDKFTEAHTQKGKYCPENTDLFIFTRRKDVE